MVTEDYKWTINLFWILTSCGFPSKVRPRQPVPEQSAQQELSTAAVKIPVLQTVEEIPFGRFTSNWTCEKLCDGESARSACCTASFCRRTMGHSAFESPFNADSLNFETTEIGQSVLSIPCNVQL